MKGAKMRENIPERERRKGKWMREKIQFFSFKASFFL